MDNHTKAKIAFCFLASGVKGLDLLCLPIPYTSEITENLGKMTKNVKQWFLTLWPLGNKGSNPWEKQQTSTPIAPAYCLREFPGCDTGAAQRLSYCGDQTEGLGRHRQLVFTWQHARELTAVHRDLQRVSLKYATEYW